MNKRIEQINNTIKIAKKHQLEIFKVHTINEELLCTCGAYKCTSQGKHPVYKDWKSGPFLDKIDQFVIRLGETNLLSNVGIKSGDGLTIVDCDSEESYLMIINKYPQLKETLTVKTSKGFHLYLKSKNKIGNKVKFLPDTDLRSEGGFVVAPGSCHLSGFLYEWINPDAEILEFPDDLLMQKVETTKKSDFNDSTNVIKEGGRNDFIFKNVLKIIGLNLSEEFICFSANQLNQKYCNPPLEDDEIASICKSASKFHENKKEIPIFVDSSMYSVVGSIVKKISPHTEANPIAIYTQMITIIGCYFGRITSSQVSGDKHFPNLMTLIVGDSAIARKGTSLGVAISILEEIIPEFIQSNLKSGATSAEGIIYHNRDPIFETRTKKGITEKICVDHGVPDKRLMVIETEFGSILISMKREGNKLSTTIRDAYDSKNLSTLSKNNSVKSTNPHISIIAHITIEELKQLLNSVDISNGFGNRFMFIYTKSDKILPEAPSIKDLDLSDEITELSKAIHFWDEALKSPHSLRFKFTPEAQVLWNEKYTHFMKNPESGIVGTLLNRNLVHAKKMALIFAMLDKKNFIAKEHLEAALAIANYSKESIKFIFKDSVSELSSKHKKVLGFLEASVMNQASRTDVSKEALKKNSSKEEIEQIKTDLVSASLININQTPNGEIWELK